MLLALSSAVFADTASYYYSAESSALSDCNIVLGSISSVGGTTGSPYGACSRYYPDSGAAGYVGSYRISEYRSGAPYATWFLFFAVADTSNDEACAAVKARTEDPSDSLFIAPGDSRSVAGSGANECRGGCTWGPKSDGPRVTSSMGGVVVATRAQYAFSGTSCPIVPASPAPAAAQIPPKPTAQVCTAAVNGQTYCTNQAGQSCYTAGTGRQICWNPGETGTKTDGAVLQKRDPGVPNPVVAPAAPPGETITQQGTSTTVVSTSIVNNVTTTTTTTTTTYVTTNGTNAGPTDSGQPTGQPGSSTTPGSGVSGGACGTNYGCTGDAVQCAILLESQKSRCASEALTSTTTNPDTSTEPTAAGSGYVETKTVGGSDLDTSGLATGGTCPVIAPLNILGNVVAIDTSKFCEWMQLGGILVMLAASLLSLKILGS